MITSNEINFFIDTVLGLNHQTFSLTTQEFSELIFPSKLFQIIGVYGKGKNGLVLKIKSAENGEIYALKLTRLKDTDDRTLAEYKIQQDFAKYNMAPELHKINIHRTQFKGIEIGFVRAIMDPIHMTIYQYLKERNDPVKLFQPLMCLIKKKYLLRYPNPYLHSDLHIDNMVILKDKKTVGFIDFGLTSRKPAKFQILDCIPLIAFLEGDRMQNMPDGKKLSSFLIGFYNKMFNVKMVASGFTRHPGGGYAYVTGKYMLHSYDWAPGGLRNAFPKETELRLAFPTFKAPIVK
jgi:hypothetical protein